MAIVRQVDAPSGTPPFNESHRGTSLGLDIGLPDGFRAVVLGLG